MGHHCACRPSERDADRAVSTEASNGVVTLAAVGRLLPSNQRLERTGAQPAHHDRAVVSAGRSTAGRSAHSRLNQGMIAVMSVRPRWPRG